MSSVCAALADFFIALDDREWGAVSALLADTVRRDYRSLFGTEPDEIEGPALAAEWEQALSGLDAHQHYIGAPSIEVDDDEARVAVHVVATHILEGDPGAPWVVGGTYRIELRRLDGDWRIVALRLDTKWQTGDRGILTRARRVRSDQP